MNSDSQVKTANPPAPARLRVRIFVDFWNFSLSIKSQDDQFKIAWQKLGPVLTTETGKLLAGTVPNYEGLHVYGSYDPNKPNDAKLKNWFANTLDKMPGVNVMLVPRQRKRGYPKCPICQHEAKACAACNHDMRGTEEKGGNYIHESLGLSFHLFPL